MFSRSTNRKGTIHGAAALAAGLASVAVALAAAAPAAADRVITFETAPTPPVGIPINKQYSPFGLTFDQAKAFGDIELPSTLVVGSVARSGSHVASTRRPGFCGDFCQNTVLGHFASTRSRVGLWAGSWGGPSETTRVTLTALNAGGGVVVEDSGYVSGAAPFATYLEVKATTNACKPYAFPCIKSFIVHAGQNTHGAFDDLTYDIPTVPHPDFGLMWSGRVGTTTGTYPAVPVAPGGSVPTSLILTRSFPSTGAIKLSGPAGPITLGFSTALTTAGDGASIPVRVSVASNAKCGTTATITGTGVAATSSAGPPGAHPFTIPVFVRCSGESVSLDGVEVTQGTQTLAALPAKNSANPTAPVAYSGVELARDAPTIVRVYASSLSPAGPVTDVGAELYGWNAVGLPLPGSPLLPDGGPRTLVPGPSTTLAHRGRPGDAYVFTLPTSWAVGLDTRYRAELFHRGLSYDDCTTTACLAQRSLTLTGIPFHLLRGFGVTPLQLVAPGILDSAGKPFPDPPAPESVFAAARQQLPEPTGKHGLLLIPYQARIDISKLVGLPKLNNAILQKVYEWEAGTTTPFAGATGDMTIGVEPGVQNQGVTSGGKYQTIAQVSVLRPLTSVAHELFHGLGRPHASPCNKALGWEAWPDPYGYTEGVGLDRTLGSDPSPGAYGYDVKLAGNPGQPVQWYDPMSYCASENDAWISPHNWDGIIGYLTDKSFTVARRAATPPVDGQLLVTATATGAQSIRIGLVEPALGPPPHGLTSDDFRLRTRDANGTVLSDVPLIASAGHEDPGAVFVSLAASVPAAGVNRVEVLRGQTVLAVRSRSPHAPVVHLLAPLGGGTVGTGGTVTVRWNASDADGGDLTVKIDSSVDGGQTWRTVYIGPNSGHVTLPGQFFPASPDGRLRLRIGDGFNESTVLTGVFKAAGAPPEVHVFAPVAERRIRADATLLLDGEAWNDASQRLQGHSLRWFDGTHPLAAGESAAVTGLAPGLHTIRLVARDSLGRTTATSTRVHVTPVAPLFLVLRPQHQVPTTARSVSLTVAASIPATLAVGSGIAIGRTPRTVSIPVTPGSGPLSLTLRLTANRRTTTANLTIQRH